MQFKIKAKRTTGEIVEETREAPDRLSLSRDLRGEGLTVFYAEPIKQKTVIWGNWFKSVGLKDKILFASNLSSMITAGLSLSRALEVLVKQTAKPYFKSVIQELLNKVNEGSSFSQALEAFPKVFPPVFSAMVAAGEESGKLPQSLAIVKEQMSKTYELRRKVVGAMIYPAIIVIVIIVIGILMMTFMVPQLSATFKDLKVDLPLTTKMVIAVSDWLVAHFILFLSLLTLSVGGLAAWARTPRGQLVLDRLLIKLPVFGELIRQFNAAVIMRTVSSLISSGVNMTESMVIASRVVQNKLYQPVIAASADEIQKGVQLSAVFAKSPKLFPVMAIELSEVGEETGDLPRLLGEGAAFYEGEIDQITKNLSTVIEPILMVFIGIAVGFFVLAMIGPMYSLSSAIK